MKGVPRELSLGWRQSASKLLGKKFDVLHAMRGREKRETFTDPRIAVARDLSDIRSSDILLVNDTFTEFSMIGSSMEIFFAHQLGKPVILFGEGHINDYWLNYHSHFRAKTLEDACAMLNKHFS